MTQSPRRGRHYKPQGRAGLPLRGTPCAPDDRAAILSMLERAAEKEIALKETAARAFRGDPALRGRMEAGAKAAAESIGAAITLVRKEILEPQRLTYPAADYVRKMTEAIDAQFAVAQHFVHGTSVYVPFAKDFFGSPASGSFSFPISLPDVRIAAAELRAAFAGFGVALRFL